MSSRPIQGAIIDGRVVCKDCAPFDLGAQKRKGVTRIYGVRVREDECEECGRRLGEPEPPCTCPACKPARTKRSKPRLQGVKSVERCVRCWNAKQVRPDCPDCGGKGWIADFGKRRLPFSWDEHMDPGRDVMKVVLVTGDVIEGAPR